MEHNDMVEKQPDNSRNPAEHLKDFQFQLVESGNPNRRPKKADCLTSLLKEEIEKLLSF